MEHRWSGWPGAWCLDCGTHDAREICTAECPSNVDWVCPNPAHHNGPCPEPGSKRNDPYSTLPLGPLNIDVFEKYARSVLATKTAVVTPGEAYLCNGAVTLASYVRRLREDSKRLREERDHYRRKYFEQHLSESQIEAIWIELGNKVETIQKLRGVAWHAAELFQEIHEKPEYANSPIIMKTLIDAVLRQAQESG